MTSQTLIEAKLQRTLTADEVTSLSVIIAVVTQFIASYTGRNYVAAPAENEELTETVKYYDGSGYRELQIDDAQEVTKVETYDAVNNTSEEVDTSDYMTYPYNTTPITSIRIFSSMFSPGTKNYKITAKWGSVTGIPDDIQGIATFLASELISNPSQVKQESIEGYSRTLYDSLPPVYQAALDSRVKIMI